MHEIKEIKKNTSVVHGFKRGVNVERLRESLKFEGKRNKTKGEIKTESISNIFFW